jgi:hypothetical protein
MTKRPQGSKFEAWFTKLKELYPDAVARNHGAYGWSELGADDNGPTLTPHDLSPHYTTASSQTYSSLYLLGEFNHNTNTGEYFVAALQGEAQ